MFARERSRAALSGTFRHYRCRGRPKPAERATSASRWDYAHSCVGILMLLVLPPAITYDTEDGQGSDRKIDDALVERFGVSFPQLLRCPRTDRALRVSGTNRCREEHTECKDD